MAPVNVVQNKLTQTYQLLEDITLRVSGRNIKYVWIRDDTYLLSMTHTVMEYAAHMVPDHTKLSMEQKKKELVEYLVPLKRQTLVCVRATHRVQL